MAAASSVSGTIGIEWCDLLRDALRKKEAGPGECVCVMNGVVKECGAEVGLDAFEAAKCLREELSFQDAIVFLRGHLQSLDDSFLDRNDNYETYLNFLIAEDLREMLKFEEAECVYKSILEKARSRQGKKAQMLCAVESLALACLCRTSWDRNASADTEKYFKQAHKALKNIAGDSGDPTERNYIIEAFVIFGEICFLKAMNEEAERCFEKALHYARLEGKESEFYVLTFLFQNECCKDISQIKNPWYESTLKSLALDEILHKRKLTNVRRFVRTLHLLVSIVGTKGCNVGQIIGKVRKISEMSEGRELRNFLVRTLLDDPGLNARIASMIMEALYHRGKKEFSIFKEVVEQKLSETVIDELRKESSDNTYIFVAHRKLASVLLRMSHYEDAERHLKLAMEMLLPRKKPEMKKLHSLSQVELNFHACCFYFMWRGNMERARSFCTELLKVCQEHQPDKVDYFIKISECVLDSTKLWSLEI